ncbi:hypothetical protein Tco_1238677 [Tanacetum coccineum]
MVVACGGKLFWNHEEMAILIHRWHQRSFGGTEMGVAEKVYSESKIVNVVKVQYNDGHGQKFMSEIVINKANGEFLEFSKSDYKSQQEDAEYMMFYEEYIQGRLRHHDQMRRWEKYVNGRPLEIDDVIRYIDFNFNELDVAPEFSYLDAMNVDKSGLSHDEHYGVDDLDLNLDLHLNLNVLVNEMQEEVVMSEVPNDYMGIGQQVQYDVEGDRIGSAYDTQYNGDFSDNLNTYDEDVVIVDKENKMIEPDVEVNLFRLTRNEDFDNIGVTSQLPDEFFQGDGVEVVNVVCFDSATSFKDEPGFERKSIERRVYGLQKRSVDCAFMKGPFPGQVLAVVGLDPNNENYPLVYTLVEVESKSSWSCLGVDKPTRMLYGDMHLLQLVNDFERCRAITDLLLNNNCKMFNNKIVGARDKATTALL